MLHTNFQRHRPFVSRVEDFTGFYRIYRHAGRVGQVNKPLYSLLFTHPMAAPYEIWLQSVSKAKTFGNVKSEWPWTKVNGWPWPLILIKVHVLIWLTVSTNFDIIEYNSFWVIHCFTFFLYKIIRHQIWPLNKLRSTWVLDAEYQLSRSSAF